MFEVISSAEIGGEWVYRLEPWSGDFVIRIFVEWGEDEERNFIASVRREKVQERKKALAWGSQALLGFLPAKHQERLRLSQELDPGRATLWSAILESLVALPIAFFFVLSFFNGNLSGNIPFWAGVLAIVALTEGLIRLAMNISSGDPLGSLFFALLGLRLKGDERDDLKADEFGLAGEFLTIQTPVPKVWWERSGGIEYQGEFYALVETSRINMSFLYRFRKGGKNFPILDPDRERARNAASDLSYVLAPLWGYLPPKMQAVLESYGRYHPRPFVRLSLAFNLLVAISLMGSDLRNISLGIFGIWNALHFVFALLLLIESVLRIYRLLQGAVTGSFLAFLVKPIYYMAIKDELE